MRWWERQAKRLEAGMEQHPGETGSDDALDN